VSTRPIADHALLSDRHSAALVTTDGSIDWLCMPRFDSSSVFAAILDDDAGHWSIRPTGRARVRRAYVEDTMVLRTVFDTGAGVLELLDAMALGNSADPHDLGEHAPHALLREVHCRTGRVEVELILRPRPEFGMVVPLLAETPGGVLAMGGPDRLTVSAPVPLILADGEARARFTLGAGQRLRFALRRTSLGEAVAQPYTQDEIAVALDVAIASWRAWSAVHQGYDGPWRELVRHSGRVLQALSYQPTGAIVAAATTSLPEMVGRKRNWDYRYSWVRDASFTMRALAVAACPDEARDIFDFLAAAAAQGRPERHLQIMFGIGGEHFLSERTLPHLRGWRGSWPVRVGNGAWDQPQLDVYGELLDAAFRIRGRLGDLAPVTRSFLIGLADAAASRWRQPDNGVWEVRGPKQHFLYSKLMSWVALDRAVAMAGGLHATHRIAEWQAAADDIREAILTLGWNEGARAFTQAFGSPNLDAAALMLPIVGFLPATDPRMQTTLDTIVVRLTDARGLVYRYLTDSGVDGLVGDEGAFLLCTFWLAEALALAGRTGQARDVFENAVAYANDVGLFAEEVHRVSGEQLGNFPQAFSHVGLVNAAWAIGRAERVSGSGAP
jgi:GH15 family glucan-1,4-alpha-glucosidase